LVVKVFMQLIPAIGLNINAQKEKRKL